MARTKGAAPSAPETPEAVPVDTAPEAEPTEAELSEPTTDPLVDADGIAVVDLIATTKVGGIATSTLVPQGHPVPEGSRVIRR
jgi:hypothetical protein